MTIEDAIRILDPATTRVALYGLSKETAVALVEDACRLAVDVMRDILEMEA